MSYIHTEQILVSIITDADDIVDSTADGGTAIFTYLVMNRYIQTIG